ncbi:MAG TPA: glycosyltransferase family 39 protein [Bryobacteraceae bacterium]|nr:glycosyltransferase family 39 protein [Bryobacteraceae bacterium]
MDADGRRPIRPNAYAILFLLFASAILLTHLPWIDLPYFWDEAGYYIPAALDLFHSGAAIPHSVEPVIHPPGLAAYLAGIWSLGGFHAETTRCAMLLLSALSALAALLLAIELLRDARGMPAFFAVALLCVSPVFFAQSLLAQPDAPCVLFATLALWLLLREKIALAAAACVALVLMKETGITAPLVFGAWLAYERRWRDAAWFLLPLAALAIWIAALYHATGYWAGPPSFVHYNLSYSARPDRILVDALRRLYYLGFANLHWIGAFAIVFAFRTTAILRTRAWRIAGAFVIVHTAAVTVLGGATLERYLLPVLPILYTAMAAGLSLFSHRPRLICSAALLAGLTIGIFVNPPYPFPFEDNLAFADFVRLQKDGADFIRDWYSNANVNTVWPMSVELTRPEIGYVDRKEDVVELPNYAPETLRRLDWSKIGIFAAYSRTWDPPLSPLRWQPVARVWRTLFDYTPVATEDEIRQIVPYPTAVHWERHGQWMDIYVNPRVPLRQPAKPLRAMR